MHNLDETIAILRRKGWLYIIQIIASICLMECYLQMVCVYVIDDILPQP